MYELLRTGLLPAKMAPTWVAIGNTVHILPTFSFSICRSHSPHVFPIACPFCQLPWVKSNLPECISPMCRGLNSAANKSAPARLSTVLLVLSHTPSPTLVFLPLPPRDRNHHFHGPSPKGPCLCTKSLKIFFSLPPPPPHSTS